MNSCLICGREIETGAWCAQCTRAWLPEQRKDGSCADAMEWAAKRARRFERQRCAKLAQEQPLAADTQVGTRQKWVKAEIAMKIRQGR